MSALGGDTRNRGAGLRSFALSHAADVPLGSAVAVVTRSAVGLLGIAAHPSCWIASPGYVALVDGLAGRWRGSQQTLARPVANLGAVARVAIGTTGSRSDVGVGTGAVSAYIHRARQAIIARLQAGFLSA